MSTYTNPNYKPGTEPQVSDYTTDEQVQYATYLWDCLECGQKTCTGAAGGVLNPCLKKDRSDPHCGNDGHDLIVTIVIAGHADEPQSVASLEGRKPGEPPRNNAWAPGN